MHNVFANPSLIAEGAEIDLSGDESRYVARVLRLKPGDRVGILGGDGSWGKAEIVRLAGEKTVLRVLSSGSAERGRPSFVLVQALPKAGRMDLIVEKATELGVSRIVPVETERVVARLGRKQKEERRERWGRVALSAARQSGNAFVPKIDSICCLDEALTGTMSLGVVIVGSLAPKAPALKEAISRAKSSNPEVVALLIGPEGDLTEDELEKGRRSGAIEASFGPAVLRVETAALFGLSVLNYEFRRGAQE